MTFMEYLKGIRPRRPKLPKLGYLGKEWGAMIGTAVIIALSITFSIGWTTGSGIYINHLFLLMLIGVPPLILYAIYCGKKYYGDIK